MKDPTETVKLIKLDYGLELKLECGWRVTSATIDWITGAVKLNAARGESTISAAGATFVEALENLKIDVRIREAGV